MKKKNEGDGGVVIRGYVIRTLGGKSDLLFQVSHREWPLLRSHNGAISILLEKGEPLVLNGVTDRMTIGQLVEGALKECEKRGIKI